MALRLSALRWLKLFFIITQKLVQRLWFHLLNRPFNLSIMMTIIRLNPFLRFPATLIDEFLNVSGRKGTSLICIQALAFKRLIPSHIKHLLRITPSIPK